MIFLFFGPPGSGKGTQTRRLSDKLHIPQISTGDLLRAQVARETDLGLEAKDYMTKGILVPDRIIMLMFQKRVKRADCRYGYILDGIPRTLSQAKELEKIFKLSKLHVQAIYLKVTLKEIKRRLLGRRVCPRCGETFHIEFSPPKKNNTCDICRAKLKRRADDVEATIATRFRVYRNDSLPVIEYYRKNHNLMTIPGDADETVISAHLEKIAHKSREKTGRILNPMIPRTDQDLERVFALEFLRVTEFAALNVYPFIGKGNRDSALASAKGAMVGMLELINVQGKIVVGNSEDDPVDFSIGERVGGGLSDSPIVHLAIAPVDGIENVAHGSVNAAAVLACSLDPPDPLNSPFKDIPSRYMEKITYGPSVRIKGGVKLSLPVRTRLEVIAKRLGKKIRELVVVVLNRPRNEKLIEEIRHAGATLRLFEGGDIAPSIAPSLPGSGVDIYMGIGGAREGTIASAAIKSLGGGLTGKMWVPDKKEEKRLIDQGYGRDLKKEFHESDLATGDKLMFMMTGICTSNVLEGVVQERGRAKTNSILIRKRLGTLRTMSAWHDTNKKKIWIKNPVSKNSPAGNNSKASGTSITRANLTHPISVLRKERKKEGKQKRDKQRSQNR